MFVSKKIDFEVLQNVIDTARHLYDAGETDKSIDILKNLAETINKEI